MEADKKRTLVEGCGDLSDLSTQLSGQQWRWDRDLRGIIQRLDYLKELGIDAIWLSRSANPQDDNGYDISDYQDIDPMFGSLDDMEELIKEAKRKISGLSWILC